jgi:uncharacterized protein YcbK (DUF882 family)
MSGSCVSMALIVVTASLAGSAVASPLAADPPRGIPHPARADGKKAPTGAPATGVLATLIDTHSPARLPLDEEEPTMARFEALLADPVLGGTHAIEPALLGLVRDLARRHPFARIEVVSGYRSERLNEALRKKGHHVATHSQHSLGHAVDLRIIPSGDDTAIDPRALAKEIRDLGWRGGVGIYEGEHDRFVHADVGPERGWYGQ